MLTQARILLLSAEGKSDDVITDALNVSPQTIRNICQRFAEAGMAIALTERPRPGGHPILDGKQEVCLVALACSDSREGRAHWTMQLRADELVELGWWILSPTKRFGGW